ncbi:MAG: P-II family nitrogen regulator [Planctomycetota bacterium]
MKKLTAFVKPFKLETILGRLPEGGIAEILIGEVRGYGRQKSHLEQYQSGEYELAFLPKVKLEIYCEDDALAVLEQAILDGARTGRIGDGKMAVTTVELDEAF